MVRPFSFSTFSVLFLLFFITSCEPPKQKESKVTVHQLSDPESLNPFNSSGSTSLQIKQNLFQKLIDVDYKSDRMVPVLAEKMPTMEKTDTGTVIITYRIRPEAEWNNGDPITAKDVAFTIKAAKCPKVNNPQKKSYLKKVKAIQFHDDPKQVSIICERYIRAKYTSGSECFIIPDHIYDPEGNLKEFSVRDMDLYYDSLASDPRVIEFAKNFNSEKYQREKEGIVGSGAYEFEKWETGKRVVLHKKEDWWGDELENKGKSPFQANPERIVYQIIDETGAIPAMKAEKLDVMNQIPARDFIDMRKSKTFKEDFKTFTVPQLSFSYIGVNLETPELRDKYTRQALAHIVDVNRIIEDIGYGFGKRVVSTVHPSKEQFHNDSIKPYPFDPEKARNLLKKAGWEDSNGNGTLDKDIDGERHEFKIDFNLHSGNTGRKKVAMMLQEEARKVGIQIDLVTQEWGNYLERLRDHDFDLYYGSWTMDPAPQDPTQLFHTSAKEGGANYCNFGDEYTDRLIDSLTVTLDKNSRQDLWYELQTVIHERVPYIFLLTPINRIAVHDRFENIYTSPVSPGYWEAGFQLTDR